MRDFRALEIPPAWLTPIESYLEFCVVRGRRPETIRSFRERLAHLARALKQAPNATCYVDLMSYLAKQDWAQETRRSRLQTFRGFWSWALQHGIVDENPTLDLPEVAPSRPNPQAVPYPLYLEALVRARARTRLILRFAGEAGLRRGEIALTHSRDLIISDHGVSLLVHGKGGKTRVVPLSQDLAHLLQCLPEGYFLPGKIDGHLSARRVSELANVALPGRWTIHKLRHMFASRGFAVSRDLLAIQELLGHASPVTTRAYIVVEDRYLRDVVEAVAARSFEPEADAKIRAREAQTITINLDTITSAQAATLIAALSAKLDTGEQWASTSVSEVSAAMCRPGVVPPRLAGITKRVEIHPR